MLKEIFASTLRHGNFSAGDQEQSLREKLAMQRQMMSLMDRALAAVSDDIVLERADWVEALVDYGHCVSFDGGRTRAYRAITLRDGALFWMVRKEGKARGFHSDKKDPLSAVEQAQAAWCKRKFVRRNWHTVEELALDLLWGRKKFRVRIDDAHASPLCSMGVTEFMHRLRMSHVKEIPGRLAAVLMWIDPQVGFVIYQANMRRNETAKIEAMTALRAVR